MTNPDLGNAANGSPSTVAPLTHFKNRNEFGDVVESFKQLPTQRGDLRYYYSTLSYCKLHRWDGTPLPFVNHIYETDVIASQQYIEQTVDETNGAYIRIATLEQIELHKMRTDPRGTITAQVRDQVEAETREKLEIELRAKIEQEIIGRLSSDAKLAGVDGFSDALQRVSTQKVPGATIIMQAQTPVLQGIVSSDNTAGNAAGSSSGGSAVAAALAGLGKK